MQVMFKQNFAVFFMTRNDEQENWRQEVLRLDVSIQVVARLEVLMQGESMQEIGIGVAMQETVEMK